MFNPAQRSQRTKQIALLTIFTALYIVLRFIPYSVLIGGSGTLNFSDFLAPIIGIILGPYLGGLSVVIGSFASIGMGKPMFFNGLDFVPDLMAVLATGFLVQQKKSRWAIVVALNAALLALFLVNPLTSVFVFSVPYAWLHIVAFAVLLTPISWFAAKWVRNLNFGKIAVGIAILTFIGVMMQSLAGNILYEVLLGQVFHVFTPADFAVTWQAVFFVYPVERMFLVISAVIIGTPIIGAILRNGLIKIGQPEELKIAAKKEAANSS
jgi:hypothetical protein